MHTPNQTVPAAADTDDRGGSEAEHPTPTPTDRATAILDTIPPRPWTLTDRQLRDGDGQLLATIDTAAEPVGTFLAGAPDLVDDLVEDIIEIEAHLDHDAHEYGDRVADQIGVRGFNFSPGRAHTSLEGTGPDGTRFLLNMLQDMGRLLDEHQAPNYLSFDLHSDGAPPVNVTLQRLHHPTAADLRRKAEQQLDDERARTDRARHALSAVFTAIDQCGDVLDALTHLDHVLNNTGQPIPGRDD